MMKTIFWLMLVLGYGLFTWTAGKRSFAMAVLCFLNGFYLALLCFGILPRAMETEFFYGAAVAAGMGVAMGFFLEKRTEEMPCFPAIFFAIVTGCFFLWKGSLSLREVLFLAFFGGMGLYHASAGIIPEKIEIRKALLAASGFLSGTILFAGF